MTEVRFDLEPHQWPPHAQGERLGFADAVFAVEWDGAQVEVAARLVRVGSGYTMIYFRAIESSQIYVVATSFGLRLSQQWYRLSSHEFRVGFIKEQLPKALGTDKFATYGRLLPFQQTAGERTNLFVAHDGKTGAWVDQSYASWTQFRLSNEHDLAIDAIEDSDSPAGFALCWSRLSHEERCRHALCFANGDWQEFQEIVRAAIYFGAPPYATAGMVISFGGEFGISDITARIRYYNVGVRLRRWAIYIARYFAPDCDENLAARHLCVSEQSFSPFVRIETAPPSQHERLEAALTLRAWATSKIPARELRLLLPKI